MFVLLRVSKKMKKVVFVGWLTAMILFFLFSLTQTITTQGNVLNDDVYLPIIMYHGLSENPKKQGRYVISPAVLEEDLKYIKENGYTTVVMQDVIEFVQKGKELPKKPVMLTFDDGNYNNYVYAYPLMQKYDCRMVISPIGEAVDRYTQNGNCQVEYATCHWKHLKEMQESGRVEIQNHSYNLHGTDSRKGAAKKTGEAVDEYRKVLIKDIMYMQQRMKEELSKAATTFVYPFGAVSKESVPLLKEMGFQATMECEERVNVITRDENCLYGLGRYLRTGQMSADSLFEKMSS